MCISTGEWLCCWFLGAQETPHWIRMNEEPNLLICILQDSGPVPHPTTIIKEIQKLEDSSLCRFRILPNAKAQVLVPTTHGSTTIVGQLCGPSLILSKQGNLILLLSTSVVLLLSSHFAKDRMAPSDLCFEIKYVRCEITWPNSLTAHS